jgi:hypothetical protein
MILCNLVACLYAETKIIYNGVCIYPNSSLLFKDNFET